MYNWMFYYLEKVWSCNLKVSLYFLCNVCCFCCEQGRGGLLWWYGHHEPDGDFTRCHSQRTYLILMFDIQWLSGYLMSECHYLTKYQSWWPKSKARERMCKYHMQSYLDIRCDFLYHWCWGLYSWSLFSVLGQSSHDPEVKMKCSLCLLAPYITDICLEMFFK